MKIKLTLRGRGHSDNDLLVTTDSTATVGDVAAQLLNELGSNLLGTLRLPLHLLQAVFGVADQDSEGGG